MQFPAVSPSGNHPYRLLLLGSSRLVCKPLSALRIDLIFEFLNAMTASRHLVGCYALKSFKTNLGFAPWPNNEWALDSLMVRDEGLDKQINIICRFLKSRRKSVGSFSNQGLWHTLGIIEVFEIIVSSNPKKAKERNQQNLFNK